MVSCYHIEQSKFRPFQTYTPNWVMIRNSLAVQWSGLRALTAQGPGSIPGRGTEIPQAAWCSQKKKKKTWVMIHPVVLPAAVPDESTGILFHLDRETLVQRIVLACLRSHSQVPGTVAPYPASSFPPHGAQSTFAPSRVAQVSSQTPTQCPSLAR